MRTRDLARLFSLLAMPAPPHNAAVRRAVVEVPRGAATGGGDVQVHLAVLPVCSYITLNQIIAVIFRRQMTSDMIDFLCDNACVSSSLAAVQARGRCLCCLVSGVCFCALPIPWVRAHLPRGVVQDAPTLVPREIADVSLALFQCIQVLLGW